MPPTPKYKGSLWVGNYPTLNDLPYSQENSSRFYQRLSGVRHFELGNNHARDKYLEQQGAGSSPTGQDNNWAEQVDMLYFTGHGSNNNLSFGIAGHDNGVARHDEIVLGNAVNSRIKWLVADACKVLAEGNNAVSIKKWRFCFKGLHQVLGFFSDCGNVPHRGELFATNLDTLNPITGASSFTVEQAWMRACDAAEPVNRREWAILRAVQSGTDVQNDRWNGYLSPNPAAPTGFVYLRRNLSNANAPIQSTLPPV